MWNLKDTEVADVLTYVRNTRVLSLAPSQGPGIVWSATQLPVAARHAKKKHSFSESF